MKTQLLVTLSLLSMMADAVTSAQEPHNARISIVHPGMDSLTADLKSMIDLTTPEEQETWVDVKDYFDLLAIGVDGSRPIRVDVLTGLSPVAYLIWVPLEGDEDNLALDFRDNLDAFGYLTRRDPQDRNLYEIDQEPEFGWLRVLPDIKYGVFVIVEGRKDLPVLKQLIQKAGDPLPDIKALTDLEPSIGAELVNSAVSEEDQQKRRTASEELRKISMDALQQRPDESDSGFGIRQKALDIQLDEGERIIAEAEEIRAWAKYDREQNTAEMRFIAKAIPGTSLHTAIAEFGTQPDIFAAIPPSEGFALSARLNHPVDQMRQTSALDFMELVDAEVKERIANSDKLSTEQQKAAQELADGILAISRDTAKSGYANAFIESIPDSGSDFTTVAGMAVPDASRASELVPLFAKAGDANEGEADVDKVGDFRIHRVRLAKDTIEVIDQLFGEERDLYVAVSDSQIWLASGEGALDALKKTIGLLGEAETHDTAIHIEARLLKWVERLDAIVDAEPEPESLDDKEAWRNRKRDLERAIQALQSDDDLVVDVTSKDDTIHGVATVNVGSIRFVGKMIAAFAKENLQ